MKVIGLTGNIGAAAEHRLPAMLRDAGVATIDADAVTREIRNNDADARAEMQERFGTYDADALARIVFNDAAALADLERILHPRVRGAVRARLAELDEGGIAAASVEAISCSSRRLPTRATRSGSSAARRTTRSAALPSRAA